jgi:hypothetical protein
MTGRRLYDALTDGWAEQMPWSRTGGKLLMAEPPAWAFLQSAERSALNSAARKLSPKRKAKS